MVVEARRPILAIVEKHQADLAREWLAELEKVGGQRTDLMNTQELSRQANEFIELLKGGLRDGGTGDFAATAWAPMRSYLGELSRTRAEQGFSPREVATFIFSFKQPLFARLRAEIRDADTLADQTWVATELLDGLGLSTFEAYIKKREEIIARQQQDLLELSTPVVKLWDGILALPMIGTLDSNRTQIVMETLLQEIVATGARIAIIDITGVPTVDTLVAQHLLKTVAAARLMGAETMISGIRPQIAQTIVHLALDLGDVTTKATLADAFRLALERLGVSLRSA